MMFVYDIVF